MKYKLNFASFNSWKPFLINLFAYSLCALFAFDRNIAGLFYGFDGAYAIVNAENNLKFSDANISLVNNMLQSIGNIQMGMNDRLFFFMWPMGLIPDLHYAKIGVYLIIGVSLFTIAYTLARHFSVRVSDAIVSGWLLGIFATPFVPRPFFYEIFSAAPQFSMIAIWPIAMFLIIRPIGHAGYARDLLCFIALMALSWLLISAGPMFVPVIVPGATLYILTLLVLSETRHEVNCKLLALAAVIILAIVLRWPWYLYGLFSYTAAYMFPSDFSVVYNSPLHVSILFQKNVFGWAGPYLAASGILGAIFSLYDVRRSRRVAAWALIAFVCMLFVMLGFVVFKARWILPTPLYLEIAIWPLYTMFCAITIGGAFRWVLNRLPVAEYLRDRSQSLLLVAPAIVIAVSLIFINRPTSLGYAFPPRTTPIVELLKDQIAVNSNAPFRGRVATFFSVDPKGGDLWGQQFLQGQELAVGGGNDLSTMGLWYFRIPTLFEYNQFSSPAFHLLIKRSLQLPAAVHQRNITIFTKPDERVLQLLGVRFVILPETMPNVGRFLLSENIKGKKWQLFELPAPNLTSYSPINQKIEKDFLSAMNLVVDSRVDLTKQAIVASQIAESLTEATKASISITGGDLRVRALSKDTSLLVLPYEYSHCLNVYSTQSNLPADSVSLHRVDGVLTGVLFKHEIDVTIKFRTGPLKNQLCRFEDYQELKAMLK